MIAGGRVTAGIVPREMLIERVEADHVQMALVHVTGGMPLPHQLVALADYEPFRAYLAQHFHLLKAFDRAGHQIEVHRRSHRCR